MDVCEACVAAREQKWLLLDCFAVRTVAQNPITRFFCLLRDCLVRGTQALCVRHPEDAKVGADTL